MATKIDRRVGCSANKFADRVEPDFLTEDGWNVVIDTPAVWSAIRPDMPHFGSPEDFAKDFGTSASTVRRLVACGSLEVVEVELVPGRPVLKCNPHSAQYVVDQHRIEAEQRAKAGRERGVLLRGGPTVVNGGSLTH